MGHLPPPVGGSAPPCPPPRQKEENGKNQPFGGVFVFFPLRIAFCPLDAPPPPTKK